MRLGDFETAHFAGSKRRHSVPAPFPRRLRSIGTAPHTKNRPVHEQAGSGSKEEDFVSRCSEINAPSSRHPLE
ncbi:MAG: hypothetical protein ABF743_05345 [Schleiferilactobacillus perolens]|uniref:hypothetical protein n=1 Tax=Schleiferilactobacillus perolens TaxID=100468 RepID=UPI0039EC6DE2